MDRPNIDIIKIIHKILGGKTIKNVKIDQHNRDIANRANRYVDRE